MAGTALFLLRGAVGATLIVYGAKSLERGFEAGVWSYLAGLGGFLCAGAIFGGILTRFFCGLVVLGFLANAMFPGAVPLLGRVELPAVFAAVIALAVLLIGPGDFSLDALFFGRREILIPEVRLPPGSDSSQS